MEEGSFIYKVVGEIPSNVDIIIGLPSLNEEKTIRNVANVVARACKLYFPDFNTFIVNVDSASKDKTVEEFMRADFYDIPHAAVICDPSKKGKGYNIKNLLFLAKRCNAKVCVMVDSDLRSIEEVWIKKLVEPILKQGYDLAVPFYIRHKFDGTITNNIVYPFIKGFLGVGIRQPIGGEFSLSSRLVSSLLKQKWFESVYKFGIDIFIVGNAILSKMNICSVFLGKKEHNPKDPGKDLEDMFVQVTYTLFKLIKENIHRIKSTDSFVDVPLLYKEDSNTETSPIDIDFENLVKRFVDGFSNNKFLYLRIFGEDLYSKLEDMVKSKEPRLADSLWAELVYKALLAFLERVSFEEEREIVKALIPLYFARVYSIFKEVKDMPALKAEQRITSLSESFFNKKHEFF